jgi:hypothetical protein
VGADKDDTERAKTISVEDSAIVKRRVLGARVPSRFDPYQGAVDKPPSRKRDLRKIDEWLKAKKRAEARKKEG